MKKKASKVFNGIVDREKIAEPIDRAPDDLKAISSYGAKTLERQRVLINALSKPDVDKAAVSRELANVKRDLDVHIGMGPEILRRYDEEYIAEARRNYAESGDPEDKEYLDEVALRRDDFVSRLMVLETASFALDVLTQEKPKGPKPRSR